MVTHRDCKFRWKSLGPVLKAVADPKRRRILDLLAEQDLPVGRIADRFSISRPAVIKHLRVLRSANLISVRRDGRERFQCLNAKPLRSVEAWLAPFAAFWENSLQKLKHQVEGNVCMK
jgi:DNA-binding transcriptional ArsR family regulator